MIRTTSARACAGTLLASLFTSPLAAQASGVATYVMSAETQSGMASGTIGGGAARRLALELGSTGRAAQPQAEHFVPPALGIGESVPLIAPAAAARAQSGVGHFGAMPQAKGKMRLFWGCGTNVKPGNRRDIDLSRMSGSAPSGLQVRPAPEMSSRGFAGFAEWPNARNARDVPGRASLVGAHQVSANYAPGFAFDLGAGQDFLAPLAVRQSQVGDAARIDWDGLGRATGYFLSVVGTMADGTVVMWNSSEVALQDALYGQYLPSAEVARLVAAKAVLPAATRSCTVPAEVVTSVETPMLMMTAFADDVDFAQPRPAGAAAGWKPQWTVKLRYKSGTMLMLGEAGAAMTAALGSMSGDEGEDEEATQSPAEQAPKSKRRGGLLKAITSRVIGD